MYLKRLEMVGFKSFAERTRLEFEPGITAIVGPNGCGKSNVVDALRWCLGEMSAKSLRSKALSDVIFNGSANRPGSNMSEVSLTFDNANRALPIDFTEVTITRRLFRSGESEYFLNKAQCRLKDIHELFLDTGIGEEGYSIMEQGRVEYILNARPEERRELFEEAAGVSKYKARREESLRKMERTQLDLDRLADVIAMTKEQMDKIEAAVRKARQYQKVRDDLKSIEISHWLWEATQLGEQIGSMGQALQVMENDLQQKTASIAQKEAELAALRWQETQQGEKLVEFNRALSELDGAIGLAGQKQTTAQEREEEIRHRDMVLDAELAQGRARQEELSRLIREVETALAAERQTAEEAGALLAQAQAVHREKEERLKEAEARARGLQESLWKKNHDRGQMHNAISAQKSLQTRLETQRSVLEKDRAKLEEQTKELEDILSRRRQEEESNRADRVRLEADSAAAQAAIKEGEERLTVLSERLSQAQNDYFRAQAQLDAQEEWEASDPYAQGNQAVLAAGLSGVHGPLGKLISVAQADENVVRRSLGAHVNDLIADTLDEARAAVRYLSEQGKGRARFIVLDRLPPSRPAPAVGVDQRPVTDLVRTDARYEPAVRFLLGGWIASGAALYGEGLLEGGSDASAGPVFDALRRENLQKDIARFDTAARDLAREKEAAEAALKQLSSAAETARAAVESSRLKAQFLAQHVEKESAQLDQWRRESARAGSEREKVAQEHDQAGARAAQLEQELAALQADEARLREEWQALQATLQERQSESLAASSALAVARERAHGHQDRLQWKEKQRVDIDAELAALAAGLEAKARERGASDQRVAEQRAIREESARAIEDLLIRRRRAAADLEALHGERQGLHGRLAEADRLLTELREATEQMKAQSQDKKLQQSHAGFKRESCETQLREKYNLSLEEAKTVHGVPADAVSVPELERLRRRVENMGPVNLAAPEEHAQLEERYNFLLTQQQDLHKAKADLMSTIQKINAATRQNLRDTFDKVRENFKLVYGQLFPGGEADVRLTDDADVLTAGVDIIAQPPGKKPQSITLLSGGEKALTAVALLFAFFMVRPAPFCVMDEVDAPLDEANVTRFITLLKTFTHQSQFIMITHNKRSMETADTMYGVTMETLGVSHVLSARLKRDDGPDAAPPERVIAEGPVAR